MNNFAVVLALVSGTSAIQWNRWTQYRMNLAEVAAKEDFDPLEDEPDRYSDTLANGSWEDDKDLDKDEDFVDDAGFENMYKGHFGFAQVG